MPTQAQLDMRKRWVEALRSGEYKQGMGLLKAPNIHGEQRHCCLGVLCELVGVPSRVATNGAVEFAGNASLAPNQAIKAVGLTDNTGSFEGNSLVDMNDTGASFEKIAHIIESNPTGLFEEDDAP